MENEIVMKKIPTAEELLHSDIGDSHVPVEKEDIPELMIKFARLHVEAALKAASENSTLLGECPHRAGLTDSSDSVYVPDPNGPDFIYKVDKESILSAYPLSNIK